MKSTFALLLFCLLIGWQSPYKSVAQGENDNWPLGNQIMTFTPSGVALTTSALLDTEEGVASISDATGNLLFYTDGSTIFNRNHQPMPNGQNLGLLYQSSSTQGALIVKDPGSTSRYYVFRLAAYGYPNGLAYVVVDMALNAGLGNVVGGLNQLTPALQLSEKMTGIVHANGRDTWVVVHGYRDSTFYSYLVSPLGVSSTPVVTVAGSMHGSGLYDSYFGGYLRASPTGEKIAVAAGKPTRNGILELLDFNTQTGRPSNPVVLARPYSLYGVEFSEDGSKLYASAEMDIYQYDLLAGASAQIIASQTRIGQVTAGSFQAHALQRGPDGKIYVAQYTSYLGVISLPNVRGTGCSYTMRGVLTSGFIFYGLPNSPNQILNTNRVLASIASLGTCTGTAVQFTGSTTPSAAGVTYRWNFGDPASGTANTATGVSPSHQYAAAGSYLITLEALAPGGQVATTTAIILLKEGPSLSLGPSNQELCPGDTRVLTAPSGTGYTYRWQDGSTASTYTVRGPGTYTVAVSAPQGCSTTGSVTFTTALKPLVTLGADTSLCESEPFRIQANAQPANSTYRWQDGSTTSSYVVTQPGTYWVEVLNSTGCVGRDSIQVVSRPCLVTIPNIITPNGDKQNDYFVLKGLQVADWELAIFNRWGRQVFSSPSYNNEWNAHGLASGIYYYQLNHKKSSQRYRGWVEVVAF